MGSPATSAPMHRSTWQSPDQRSPLRCPPKSMRTSQCCARHPLIAPGALSGRVAHSACSHWRLRWHAHCVDPVAGPPIAPECAKFDGDAFAVQQRTKEFPMIRNSTRYSLIASLLASAPWLCGADGSGCDKAHSPSSATDVGSLCVAEEGQHCGGNIAHPCSCGTGLFCTSGSSALPSGDAGGTCEKAASTAAGSGGGRASAGAGSSQGGQGADAGQPAPVDGGECVSKQGERCGGNTLHPCTCSPAYACPLKAAVAEAISETPAHVPTVSPALRTRTAPHPVTWGVRAKRLTNQSHARQRRTAAWQPTTAPAASASHCRWVRRSNPVRAREYAAWSIRVAPKQRPAKTAVASRTDARTKTQARASIAS
jgi:hypothetical protein